MTEITFRAFHGTRARHLGSIEHDGIRPSSNEDDWLGTGTYFFVDGLEDPRLGAFEWSRTTLWNKDTKTFIGEDVAVIEAFVTLDVSRVFDLREAKRAHEFHRFRRHWIKHNVPKRSTHLARPAKDTYDGRLLDAYKHENGFAGMVGDFYIKFLIRERHFRIDSRIPNISILCVTHPLVQNTTVQIANIEVLKPTTVLESELEA